MSIWISAYIDSNRFAIFTDLLQLVAILSQISTPNWQQANSALFSFSNHILKNLTPTLRKVGVGDWKYLFQTEDDLRRLHDL